MSLHLFLSFDCLVAANQRQGGWCTIGDKEKPSWLRQAVGNNCTPYHSRVDGVLAERTRANTRINIVTKIL
jgi:hypothetical protein